MLVHVAVSDSVSSFVRGVTLALRSRGVSASAPKDLVAWVRADQVRVVLLTLTSEGDWARLDKLRSLDDRLLIVAMLEDTDQRACLRALAAGAAGVLPRDASPKRVAQTVGSLVRGEAIVPLPLIRALTAQARPEPAGGDDAEVDVDVDALEPSEVAWLRGLANGATVRHLANEAGYSERMMFRLLNNLYHRLEVNTRTEALFLARERGWI